MFHEISRGYSRRTVRDGGGRCQRGAGGSVNKICLSAWRVCTGVLLAARLAFPSHICEDPVEILLSGHSLQNKCQSAVSHYQ